jgi:hypothetical protein
MKIVNIEKQRVVLKYYIEILKDCLEEDKNYHFKTIKQLVGVIFDSILEKNTETLFKKLTFYQIVDLKLTSEQINKGVYICQQMVQDVDYANNLFALSQKHRNLV